MKHFPDDWVDERVETKLLCKVCDAVVNDDAANDWADKCESCYAKRIADLHFCDTADSEEKENIGNVFGSTWMPDEEHPGYWYLILDKELIK